MDKFHKRVVIAAASLMLACGPASAQEAQSPIERALGVKLVSEMSAGIQCNAALITVQQQLAAAQARVKELEGEAVKPAPDTKP